VTGSDGAIELLSGARHRGSVFWRIHRGDNDVFQTVVVAYISVAVFICRYLLLTILTCDVATMTLNGGGVFIKPMMMTIAVSCTTERNSVTLF